MKCDVIHNTLPSKTVKYSTFPPATLQNNLSFNYFLIAYHVTVKLLQYKFISGSLLIYVFLDGIMGF